MKRPWLLHPQELAVCGHRGSGKTTLLERLTSTFVQEEIAVAYLKHDAHHFDLDREGKDTDRLGRAGARPVTIASAQESAKLHGPGVEGLPPPLAGLDFLDADLLFVEGWKSAQIPRLAMLDMELSLLADPCWKERNPVALAGSWRSEPAAVSAWRGCDSRDRDSWRVPYFFRDDVAAIANWIRNRVRERLTDRPVLGLILSGGKSERMGTDKAELRFNDGSQLDEACALLERICPEVYVSCRSEQAGSPSRKGKQLLIDRFCGFGPLGGILTAMHEHPQAAWFVSACDLPFLDQQLVTDLLKARDGMRLATAYVGTDGLPEPLCAIWEPHALPRLHQFLGLGIDCPRKVLLQSRIRLVHARNPASLENVNERARFQEIASSRSIANGNGVGSRLEPSGMISVAELDIILARLPLPDLPLETIGAAYSPGRVLAATITADLDQPPFHRAAMDGLALRAGVFYPGQRQEAWTSRRVRAAGDTWQASPGEQACEIMTGASLPEGFDTVVPYEDLRELAHSPGFSPSSFRQFCLRDALSVRAGQNVHRRASDYGRGDVLVVPPRRLRSADVHTLVSAGHQQVVVRRKVSIGILATGSEILDGDAAPGPSRIRASNHSVIAAELAAAGWMESEAATCDDDEKRIEHHIADLLRRHDVLLVTGGLSKGRFDFVPSIMQRLGIVTLAHGAALKPGKPLLVGSYARPGHSVPADHEGGSLATVPVFGLPGNPVSCLVILRRFVLPFLRRWEGCPEASIYLPLAGDEPTPSRLARFLVARLKEEGESLQLEQLPLSGSGCFRQLVGSHGIAELPAVPEYPRRDGLGKLVLRFWPWAGALG